MTVQRNWSRDMELDALAQMAQDWTPRFRVMQGFAGLPEKLRPDAKGEPTRAETPERPQ